MIRRILLQGMMMSLGLLFFLPLMGCRTPGVPAGSAPAAPPTTQSAEIESLEQNISYIEKQNRLFESKIGRWKLRQAQGAKVAAGFSPGPGWHIDPESDAAGDADPRTWGGGAISREDGFDAVNTATAQIDAYKEAIKQNNKQISEQKRKIKEITDAAMGGGDSGGGDSGGGGGGHCLTGDMLVLQPDGGYRPLASIRVGDRVMSYDSAGDRPVIAAVEKIYGAKEDALFLINGRLKATGGHPFMTPAGGQVKTADLRVSDRVQGKDGVIEIRSVERLDPETTDVYNLTVSGTHVFYVSPDRRETYLLHNK